MPKKRNSHLSGIKEIARRAKVSIGTVDRVIHNRSGVSPATRGKIAKIISDLNYQPNLLARRLASRKIIRVATLIPKVSEETSFWQDPLRGIEQAGTEIKPYGVLIDKYFFDQNNKSSFVKVAKQIMKSKPDGILLAPSFIEESVSFSNQCKEAGIPYVFIDSDIPDQKSLCYIGPDIYRSGYLAGNLADYLIKEKDQILIVNISKEIDNYHHVLRTEDGFRSYFKDRNKNVKILKVDLKQIDYPSIEKGISDVLAKHRNIRLIFVTNSRVSTVARLLEKSHKKVILIGYDLLKENIEYLDKGIIDFLICHKPFDQAYKGIMALYQHLALSASAEKIQFMPIDIITKENYSFYQS